VETKIGPLQSPAVIAKMAEPAQLCKEAYDFGLVAQVDGLPVASRRRSTATSTFEMLLEPITIVAPNPEASSATANPIPVAPPMTTTRFPLSEIAASALFAARRPALDWNL
jgi:hypothetical protein